MSPIAVPREQAKTGLAVLAFVFFGLVFALLGFAFYIDPGASAKKLMPISNDIAVGSVIHYKAEHFYLVRLGDVRFIALYDIEVSCEAAVSATEPCTVIYYPTELNEWLGWIGIQVNGVSGVLQDGRRGSRFSMAGQRLYGPAYGDLERFAIITDSKGNQSVDLNQRIQCERRQPVDQCAR